MNISKNTFFSHVSSKGVPCTAARSQTHSGLPATHLNDNNLLKNSPFWSCLLAALTLTE